MRKKQIIHISVHQTSKVIAAMHVAMLTLLFILPSVIGYLYHGQVMFGITMLFLLPLFMWVLMYIAYLIACWFYNLIVPWTGGIELEVADMYPEGIPPKSDLQENVLDFPEQKMTPPIDDRHL